MANKADCNFPKLQELLTTQEINKTNNISKITDKIYLGDEEGATNFEFLKEEKIHYVLSLNPDPPKYPNDMNINHIVLDIEKNLKNNFVNNIKKCFEFIENADKIFIHCSMGINRGPAIIIGYLMWKTHSSYEDAFEFVKKIRESIEPNNLFIIQLHKFEKSLKNNNYDLTKIEVKSNNK
jgi:protein-tyrosine phosphatase